MSNVEKYNYEKAVHRNYGIFTPEEQEKIKKAKILIVGCGGVGGTLAVILARGGVGNFTLVDFDDYEITNMNRQIGCFVDTLGKNKAEVLNGEILRINPTASVNVINFVFPDQWEELVKLVDIVLAEADDFSMSIMAMRAAKKLGKFSVTGYPMGAFTRVSVFPPWSSRDPEEYFALPKGQSYKVLRELTVKPEFRKWGKRYLRYYKEEGCWTEEWFNDWIKGEKTPTQIAPMVWLTACLVALEVLKIITGKWEVTAAPKHWHITPTSAGIEEFKPPPGALRVVSFYLKLKEKLGM